MSDAFFDTFLKEHHCVAARSVDTDMASGRKLSVHRYYDLSELEDIFVAYHFDAILFFSYDLDGGMDVYKELERLEFTLTLARKYDVKMFLYVSSNELENRGEAAVLEGRARYIVNVACEELCRVFQKSCGIKTRIIRLPYIYTKTPSECRACYLMRLAKKEGEIILRADPDREIDAVCDEDLGAFLMRVLDDPGDEDIRTVNLGGGNRMRYEEFADMLTEQMEGVKVSWLGEQYAFPMYLEDLKARDDYDWEPVNRLKDDIGELFKAVDNEEREISGDDEVKKEKSFIQKLGNRIRHPFDIIVVMGAAEILLRLIPESSLISPWDIRLFAVLLLGTIDGIAAGVTGAVIASAFYIGAILAGHSIFSLFREPSALIPVALYVLGGGISGYLCDHKNDEIEKARADEAHQRDRYAFLSGLYARARESKEDFQNQILGFRNSYGRIYSLMKRIEEADDDKLYSEAISSMEEMLESRSISIYKRIGAGENYTEQARSRGSSRRIGASITLKDYPDMYSVLQKGETYFNRELTEGYPAFAAPVFSDDEMSGIIMLTDAKYRHMNMEYVNKFTVVSGIISADLVRVMRMHSEREEEIKDARLMDAKDFLGIVRAHADENGSILKKHTLLLIKPVNLALKEAVRRITRMTRGDDIIGTDERNRVLLLLPDTEGVGASIVMEKLRTEGIDSEIIPETGAL